MFFIGHSLTTGWRIYVNATKDGVTLQVYNYAGIDPDFRIAVLPVDSIPIWIDVLLSKEYFLTGKVSQKQLTHIDNLPVIAYGADSILWPTDKDSGDYIRFNFSREDSKRLFDYLFDLRLELLGY